MRYDPFGELIRKRVFGIHFETPYAMNDEQEHSQPRMLTMHKRTITMSDGKRQMTFYTFDSENPRIVKARAGSMSDHAGASSPKDQPSPSPEKARE